MSLTEQASPPTFGLDLWATSRAKAAKSGIVRPYEPARVTPRFTPAAEWIERNVLDPTSVNLAAGDYSRAKLIKLEEFQKRILDKVLTPNDRGYFPYSTIIWSQPKKSGKTQTAGSVAAWYASEIEAPNLVLTLANDQEQSAGRIFAALAPTLGSLGSRIPRGATATPEITLSNGTTVKAIANNYAGAAGANYGATFWSELWAYTSERSQRLYDELVPVPTRKNSIRWIETYAGFEDESDLLLSIFLRIFKEPDGKEPQPNARPVPGLEDIRTSTGDGDRPACWHIPEEGLFVFWDHELRMPWHINERGEQFVREQKADLRRSTFIRLWENRWQSSVGGFIEPEWIDQSFNLREPRAVPMVFAGDASQRNDTTSLIGIERVTVPVLGRELDRYRTGYVRVWNPGGKDIDLEETIGSEVERLHDLGLLIPPFYYDPFQMHQVAVNLRKKGIPCLEFPQGNERVLADSFLYKLYKNGSIDNFPDKDLDAHLRAAKAKELDNEQMRIVKGTLSASGKVDAAVAQSMAAWKASLRFAAKKRKQRSSSTSHFD